MIRRTSISSLVALLAILATNALSVGAQTSAADPLFRFDPTTRKQLEGLRDSAAAAGLPSGLLVLKAREGYAKKADPKRVVVAVRQLLADLRSAHRALETTNESELMAGVDALAAKVTVAELEQFRSDARGRSPTMALSGLSTIISLGVARDVAVPQFLKLWKGGSIDSDFEMMLRQIDQDVHSGMNPGAALTNRARELPVRPPRPPGGEPEDSTS